MNKVVFKPSPATLIFITLLVAGLLVFVWLHWRGQRTVALVIFSALTVLATTLYTLRSEVSLSVESRELSGKSTWMGIPVRRIIVRVGSDDALHLTEELTGKGSQGVSVWHRLEAGGKLVSHQTDTPGPYILTSQTYLPSRAKLEDFAKQSSTALGVPLEDRRKFTERVKTYKEDVS